MTIQCIFLVIIKYLVSLLIIIFSFSAVACNTPTEKQWESLSTHQWVRFKNRKSYVSPKEREPVLVYHNADDTGYAPYFIAYIENCGWHPNYKRNSSLPLRSAQYKPLYWKKLTHPLVIETNASN